MIVSQVYQESAFKSVKGQKLTPKELLYSKAESL